MKRDFFCWFIAVTLTVASANVARSKVAISVSARNIEYSKPSEKYLLNAAQHNAMLRRPDVSKAVNGYLLGASAEKSYKPSEVINVRVALMNTGADTIKDDLFDPALMYNFSVMTPQGNLAPLTLYGQKALGSSALLSIYHHHFSTFKTGSEIVSQIQLSRYYDMTLQGAYTIAVSKIVFNARGFRKVRRAFESVPEDEKPSTVYAEPITLTVE